MPRAGTACCAGAAITAGWGGREADQLLGAPAYCDQAADGEAAEVTAEVLKQLRTYRGTARACCAQAAARAREGTPANMRAKCAPRNSASAPVVCSGQRQLAHARKVRPCQLNNRNIWRGEDGRTMGALGACRANRQAPARTDGRSASLPPRSQR